MPEPISVPLTPAQAVEFAALARRFADAQLALNHAARAVVLGVHPLAAFDGQQLHVNTDTACITFLPNAMLPALPTLVPNVPDTPQPETVS